MCMLDMRVSWIWAEPVERELEFAVDYEAHLDADDAALSSQTCCCQVMRGEHGDVLYLTPRIHVVSMEMCCLQCEHGDVLSPVKVRAAK